MDIPVATVANHLQVLGWSSKQPFQNGTKKNHVNIAASSLLGESDKSKDTSAASEVGSAGEAAEPGGDSGTQKFPYHPWDWYIYPPWN